MRLLPALLVTSLLVLPALAADKPKLGTFGVDLTSIDKSVKPGDNFFRHVNGKWLKTAVIPPDRSQAGSFQDLQILSETRMRAIIDDLEKKPRDQLNPAGADSHSPSPCDQHLPCYAPSLTCVG